MKLLNLSKSILVKILFLIVVLLLLVSRFAYIGFNRQVHGHSDVLTSLMPLLRVSFFILCIGYFFVSFKICKLFFQNMTGKKKYLTYVLFGFFDIILLLFVGLLGALFPIPI